MNLLNRIAVFCGSSMGDDPAFSSSAMNVGKTLAQNNIELVYGGAKIGLMGAVADGVLQSGGRATGVIPEFLKNKEVAHTGLTELITVSSMHERKTKMNDLCDGVIALPGGFGTLEELFEILTWAQLGLHQKPIGLLNINGFYNCLVELLNTMVSKKFLRPENYSMLLVANNINDLLHQMKHFQPPIVAKWISDEKL